LFLIDPMGPPPSKWPNSMMAISPSSTRLCIHWTVHMRGKSRSTRACGIQTERGAYSVRPW
jgi:hypothetical protein